MIATRKRATNRRKSGVYQRRTQNLLEVTVRSQAAIQKRNRFVLAWTCRILLAVGLVAGCVYGVRQGLRHFLWENPEYSLAAGEVNDDGAALTREVIMNTAGLKIGQNVFSFSLAKAREAVTALPQVDHVEMQRVLPNKVTIDLTERRPLAWIADAQSEDPSASDKSFLVDAKHVLFKPKRALPEYLRLPAIYGVPMDNFLSGEVIDKPEVTAALDLITRNGDTARFQIRQIDVSKGYCMIATDSKRARVTFGLDKVDQQLERLAAVVQRFSSPQQEIQTVNLLPEKNIPVTFAPPPGRDGDNAEAMAPAVAEGGNSKHDTKSAAKEKEARSDAKRIASASADDHVAVHTAAVAKNSDKSQGKKKPAIAENRDRKKTLKKAKGPDRDVPVKRAEPVVRRALPAMLATSELPASAGARNRGIFSFFHGQR